MSITIGVRFRPVDGDGRADKGAREEARNRWSETLKHWPGVESWEFEKPAKDPPRERKEVVDGSADIPPVDLTIVFETGNHADSLFGNSDLVVDLNGTLAGPHAVHTVGVPQVNGTPAESPSS